MQTPKLEPVEPTLLPTSALSGPSSLPRPLVDAKRGDEVKSEADSMQASMSVKVEESEATSLTTAAGVVEAAVEAPYLPTPPPGSVSGHPCPAQADVKPAQASTGDSAQGLTQPAPVAATDLDGDAGAESDDSLSSADSEIARNASPSHRRTVLFSDDATFPSKAKFVSETKKLLYRRYGVTAWLNQNQTHFAVLKCAQQQSRCSFRVRTEQSRGGTEWTLASGRCVWVHNHDMQGDEEERASWSSSEDEAAGVGSKRGGKASSEEERPLPAGTGGPWSAPTKSASMKRLVADRVNIFALQQRLRPSSRQEWSATFVDAHLKELSTSNTVPRSAFTNYCRFAEANQIPPFPLTPAILALWFYDKCSKADGFFNTYKRSLENIMELEGLQRLWANQSTYKQLLSLDPDSTAINEFIQERNPSAASRQAPKASTWTRPISSASPKKKKKQTRVIKSAAFVNSSDDDAEYRHSASDSASATTGDDSGGESEVELPQASSREVGVPGLPSATDTFASATDVFKAYVKALVPVYGISVTKSVLSATVAHIKCNRHHPHYSSFPGGVCSWQAVVKQNPKTKRWRVDFDSSYFKHSHGPCKEILRDPSYRPTVRNPDAREALGMSLLDAPSYTRNQDAISKPERGSKSVEGKEKEKKKRDREKERDKVEQDVRTAKTKGKANDMPPPAKKPRPSNDAAPEPGPPRSTVAISKAAFAQPYPDTSQHYASHAPAPLPSSRTYAHSHIAPAPLPTVAYTPSLAPMPFSDVAAFLHGMHRSLEPLAIHFVAAGLSTVDALASLTLLEPVMIDHTLELMRIKAEASVRQSHDASPPPTVIQLRLLAKSLKEAGRS